MSRHCCWIHSRFLKCIALVSKISTSRFRRISIATSMLLASQNFRMQIIWLWLLDFCYHSLGHFFLDCSANFCLNIEPQSEDSVRYSSQVQGRISKTWQLMTAPVQKLNGDQYRNFLLEAEWSAKKTKRKTILFGSRHPRMVRTQDYQLNLFSQI